VISIFKKYNLYSGRARSGFAITKLYGPVGAEQFKPSPPFLISRSPPADYYIEGIKNKLLAK